MKKLLALLVLPLCSLNAQIGGNSVYSFLNLVPSARISAQGSHAIANPEEDLNFALYNPALLREEMNGHLTFSLVDFVAGISHGDINYAHHFEGVGTFYGGLKYVNYGEFDRANVIGVREGTFTAGDYAFNLGYGYTLDSNWSFGGSLKTIYSSYDSYESYGTALDIAANYQIPSKRFVFALLARNIGFQYSAFSEGRENIPFELQFGISNRFEHLPLRWQLTFVDLNDWELRYRDPNAVTVDQFTGQVNDNFPTVWNNILRHVVVGMEFTPTKNFNLQFGYNFRKRQELNLDTRRTSAGFSFGIGLKISKFRINYGRNFYHVSGNANHFTIRTDLQDFRKKKKKEINSDT